MQQCKRVTYTINFAPSQKICGDLLLKFYHLLNYQRTLWYYLHLLICRKTKESKILAVVIEIRLEVVVAICMYTAIAVFTGNKEVVNNKTIYLPLDGVITSPRF